MKSVHIIASVGLAKAANVTSRGDVQGIDFNMTEAEWAESQAAFDKNMEEYEQGNYVSNLEVNSRFTKCDQECSEWCWATSATMASSSFTSISQSECVSYEARAASMKTGAQCNGQCSNRCDQPGSPSDIISAIQQFSGASYRTGNSLSQQQLDSALQGGPVIILVRWNGGGGHAITCHGVSNGKYQIHDPEGQEKSLAYNQVMHYQNQGTWSQTVYTQGGPAPGPSPGPSGRCNDYPSNWRSSEGDSCQDYTSSGYCTPNGRTGSGWRSQWGRIEDYADRYGRSAYDACCGCGGGSGSESVVV